MLELRPEKARAVVHGLGVGLGALDELLLVGGVGFYVDDLAVLGEHGQELGEFGLGEIFVKIAEAAASVVHQALAFVDFAGEAEE